MQRSLAKRIPDREAEILAIEQMGHSYIKHKDYKSALICFKKQLELSWCSKKMKATELKSYDNIGMAFYYLNELDKATYYHNRYANGYYESDQSGLKKSSQLKQKWIDDVTNRKMGEQHIRGFFVQDQNDIVTFVSTTPISEIAECLPSPYESSHESDIVLFPNYSLSNYNDDMIKRSTVTAAQSKYKKNIIHYKLVLD